MRHVPFRLALGRLPLLMPLLALLPLAAGAQERNVACTGGQAGAYACAGVDLMAHLPLSTFASPGSSAPSANNDIWGWTDPETGREYALVGLNNGTAFVDVTDPDAPLYLGKLPTATTSSSWRDVKVYANHAFIVSEASSHGMQVFDLTRLRTVASPPVTFTADARYTGNGKAHNIAINEDTGFAYLVGANQSGFQCRAGGLHMVNIQNPLQPVFAGCFDTDGYTHDVQCVVYQGPDTQHNGREVCFASNEDTVTIVDVTNKATPVQLSRVNYPNPGYTHQGWLTDDRRYFLVDDETDAGQTTAARTIVLRVEDLDSPEVAFIQTAPTPGRDHNLYVRGDYVFLSNYSAGLRIYTLMGIDTGSLSEVAHFDTYPSTVGSSGYNGQWSNYPYFASGNVIANDIQNGLFVLRPTGQITTAGETAPGESGYALSAPVPNPTTGRTRIDLSVGAGQHVRAEAFDALGRRVAVVFEGAVAPGAPAHLLFDAAGLPSGAYVVRVTGEAFVAAARVTVVR